MSRDHTSHFPGLAIERSAATFPSAAPFQPFYTAHFPRPIRNADGTEEMFSSSSEKCRPETESSSQSDENGAKATQTKWFDAQTSVLVEEWKERVEEVESSRSLEAWQKIVQAVNKAGPFKTMKQCKDKLRNLKQAYKDAKTNNSQTGRAAKTSPFFDAFEEVLGSRPVVKMPGVLQSCSESTTSNSPSSSKSSHTDSSDSDGNADSSPKEGKNKRKKAKANELLKRKQGKAKKAIKMLSLNCLQKYSKCRTLKWKRSSDHKQEQRSLCSRWKSSRGKSMKKAEEGIRNFSFAWQNF